MREAMLPWLSTQFGNPSSRHAYGRAARQALDMARQQVAAAVNAHPTEVVFTSSGSEANNLFIKGAAGSRPAGLLAISAIEHPCVLRPARQVLRRGWRLRQVAVDAQGVVDDADFVLALQDKPDLVSIMLANNETGALQPVADLAERLAEKTQAWFHSDAAQALGRLPLDFRALNKAGLHALTLSAHKTGGPKGAAALIVDKRVELEPLVAGGGQERDLRAGTENMAAIVGFGVAATLAVAALERYRAHVLALRHQLENGLSALGATLFSQGSERLPNTVYFAFPRLDGETLVGYLDQQGFAVASGAACSSHHGQASHVLQAMGVVPEIAQGAVRVSLGMGLDAQIIADFIQILRSTVKRLTDLQALAG